MRPIAPSSLSPRQRVLSALLPVFFLAAPPALASEAEPPLIPRPAELAFVTGEFDHSGDLAIGIDADDPGSLTAAEWLIDLSSKLCGRRLRITDGEAAIRIGRHAGADDESYRLDVGESGLQLSASGARGQIHAATSAAQLLCWPGRKTLPALRIVDRPQFGWRGAMLDSARHMQSLDYIRRFIDAMALHKLNVLHWHLTDDQGWRLEIKRYPKLTEVGGFRVPAGAGARDIDPDTGEARRYGGWYTQNEARALIAYAAARGIQILPEIDVPGHANAAIAAYPELATLPPAKPGVVPADWGIYPETFTLEDHGFTFFEHVLDEVMALFPAPWIHVGGDEVSTAHWEQSARGRELLAELPGEDPHRLQTWYTQRIARHVESRGKRLIGWDEILTPGMPENAVVMSWRGIDGAIAAAQQGHDAILSPWPTLYLDNRQSDLVDEPPGRLRTIGLADVYAFDPHPSALTENQLSHLLGIQANIWTEHIRTEARVSHMGFPRLAALAELGWTAGPRRDYAQFVERLAGLFPHYARLGIEAADSEFAVRIEQSPAASGAIEVRLSAAQQPGSLHYRLDGRPADAGAPTYTEPFTVAAGYRISAVQVLDGRPLGTPREALLDPRAALRRSSRELALCSDGIALGLEDDAPARGNRAVFALDIQNPCWRWEKVDLSQPMRLRARVGQLPFNFQIGAAREAIRFPKPRYQGGELLVFLDSCEGEPAARLPLGSAHATDALSTLATASLPQRETPTTLCLRFAQSQLEPLWALDQLELEAR